MTAMRSMFNGKYAWRPRRRQRRKYFQKEATRAARQIWETLFPGEKFDCVVYFARIGYGCLGDYHRGVVRLNLTMLKRNFDDTVSTVVHEFNHHRNKAMRHGDAFDWMVVEQCERIGVNARVEKYRIWLRVQDRECAKERHSLKRAAEKTI